MNSHGTEPPNKHKSDAIPALNVLDSCEMVIKQEPTIKQEPGDGDGIVTVSRLTHTVNGPTDIFGDEQVGGNADFVDVCELDAVKLEVKIEKVIKKTNHVPEKSFDQNRTLQNNVKKHLSKEREQKMDGLDGVTKKTAADNKKKLGTIGFNDQKNQSEGRANGKRHKCSFCDYNTDFTIDLKRHMFKHIGEKPFPCAVCPKRFITKQNLRFHMKAHDDEFLFSCSNCSQGFHNSEEKVEHEADCTIHHYECHLCKEFSTFQKMFLKRHLRVHSGERPFKCDQCSKKFAQASNLKRHRKTHANHRPLKFKCSVCFKIFTKQEEKENHEDNCKQRGYKCDVCQSYTTHLNSNLVRHMRIHTGEKPFQCEICSKCFTRNTNLNKHTNIHK